MNTSSSGLKVEFMVFTLFTIKVSVEFMFLTVFFETAYYIIFFLLNKNYTLVLLHFTPYILKGRLEENVVAKWDTLMVPLWITVKCTEQQKQNKTSFRLNGTYVAEK